MLLEDEDINYIALTIHVIRRFTILSAAKNVERFHWKKVLCRSICGDDNFFHSIAPQSTGIWELSLIQPLAYTAEICFEEIVEEKGA